MSGTNDGFIVVIFSPDFDFTHSLLMKIPVGCVYLRPFGAVNSIVRSDILAVVRENVLLEDLDKNSRSLAGLRDRSED